MKWERKGRERGKGRKRWVKCVATSGERGRSVCCVWNSWVFVLQPIPRKYYFENAQPRYTFHLNIALILVYSLLHHSVSGINSLITSVSFASHVSTHFLTHLSAHLCHHHHSHHASLLHSFIPCSKQSYLFNKSFPPWFLLPTRLPSWQRDWTGPIMLNVLFLVSHFNFFVCSVWWTKLAGCPSAFYCTSNTHYRIVGKDYIGRIIKYTLCPKKTVVPNFGDNFVKS